MRRRALVGTFPDLEERLFAALLAGRAADPLRPAVVVTGSSLLALYLERRYALHHSGHINLRFCSIYDLAGKLGNTELENAGREPLSPVGEAWLGRRSAESARELWGLHQDAAGEGLSTALLSTFRDLREAGFEPSKVNPVHRVGSALPGLLSRTTDLWKLYSLFRQGHHGRSYDTTDLFDSAARASRRFEQEFGTDHVYLYGFYDLNASQRRFVEALAACTNVDAYVPGGSSKAFGYSEAAVRWLGSMGFEIISLPYSKYDVDMDEDEYTEVGVYANVDTGGNAGAHGGAGPVPGVGADYPAYASAKVNADANANTCAHDNGSLPPPRASVRILAASSETSEAREVAREALRLAGEERMSFNDMAVLLRDHRTQGPLFCEIFDELQIPYYFPSGSLESSRHARSLKMWLELVDRGYKRFEVMEWLGYAPLRWESLCGGAQVSGAPTASDAPDVSAAPPVSAPGVAPGVPDTPDSAVPTGEIGAADATSSAAEAADAPARVGPEDRASRQKTGQVELLIGLWDRLSREHRVVAGHDDWLTRLIDPPLEEETCQDITAVAGPDGGGAASRLRRFMERLLSHEDALRNAASWEEISGVLTYFVQDLLVEDEAGHRQRLLEVVAGLADLDRFGESRPAASGGEDQTGLKEPGIVDHGEAVGDDGMVGDAGASSDADVLGAAGAVWDTKYAERAGAVGNPRVLQHVGAGGHPKALEDLTFTGHAGFAGDVRIIEHIRFVLGRALEKSPLGHGRYQEGGINLLPLMPARGMSFKAIFLPGMLEGRFPARGRQDPLLPDTQREILNTLAASGKGLGDLSRSRVDPSACTQEGVRTPERSQETLGNGKQGAPRTQGLFGEHGLSGVCPPSGIQGQPGARVLPGAEPTPGINTIPGDPTPALEPLPTSKTRPAEELMLFALATIAASERLVLSYSKLDSSGRPRSTVPSGFLLSLAGAVPEDRVVRRDPGGFPFVEELGSSLDSLEFDVTRVARPGEAGPGHVGRSNRLDYLDKLSSFAPGAAAFQESRRSRRNLTRYDGMLLSERALEALAGQAGESGSHSSRSKPAAPQRTRTPVPESDPGDLHGSSPRETIWRVGPTRLETYATCPFRFFLSMLIGIELSPEPEDLWQLLPIDKGGLVHKILSRFFTAARDNGWLPVGRHLGRCKDEMVRASEAEFDAFRPDMSYGHPWLLAMDRSEILEDLLRVLEAEAEEESDLVPTFFEQTFELETSGLRLRGRIDRIDCSRDRSRFRVVDYKTGKPTGKNDSIKGGEQLQLPIYLMAGAQILRERGLFRGQSVDGSEAFYFHINRRSGLRRIRFSAAPWEANLRTLTGALQALVRSFRLGVFAPYPGKNEGNCRFCDFALFCGPGRSLRFERKSKDPLLVPFLSLKEEGSADE